ncbi:hypothetical protein E2C01_081192 [Portunus trituberculatus]|uniref:Uncharacterized protein n=1 Tax=Portunus trituberculatus TaxID=210409 RepID=A0A5B7IY11_PORTR|nr:hypothetical protein [Portunus trituberculatus]
MDKSSVNQLERAKSSAQEVWRGIISHSSKYGRRGN